MTGEASQTLIEEFARLYAEREELERRSATAPELLKDILAQAVSAAGNRMSELAEDEKVRDYYRKLGGQVVEAVRALDEIAPTLEALGMSEQLETKRREIAGMASSGHMDAASFFIDSKLVGVRVLEDEVLRPTPEPELSVAAPVSRNENREDSKPHLAILVDQKNNISLNGQILSLNRDLKIAGKVGAEAIGRALRVDALRFMSEHPGEEFRASDIWQNIRPGQELDRNTWNLYCRDFFRSEFTYADKPIVTVDKVRPRLLHYSIKDFDVTIGTTDKVFEIADETVFTLPDGREVGGNTGKFMNLLWRATLESPVTDEAINKLFTPEELAAIPDEEKRNLLSGLASRARREVRDTTYSVIKILSDKIDPTSHRRYPAYFMVNPEVAGRPGSILQSAEDLTLAERAAVIEELSDELESPLSLHEAAVLAGMLNHYNNWLTKHGLAELPYDTVQALNKKVVETYTNGKKTESELKILRVVAFEKARHLLSDPKRLEDAVDLYGEHNDPRETLLIQLMEYNTEEGLAYLKELLDSVSDFSITFEGGKGFVGRGGVNVVGSSTRLLGSNGDEL